MYIYFKNVSDLKTERVNTQVLGLYPLGLFILVLILLCKQILLNTSFVPIKLICKVVLEVSLVEILPSPSKYPRMNAEIKDTGNLSGNLSIRLLFGTHP